MRAAGRRSASASTCWSSCSTCSVGGCELRFSSGSPTSSPAASAGHRAAAFECAMQGVRAIAGDYRGVYPDQGQPAASRRGGDRLSTARPTRAWGSRRAASPSCWWRWRCSTRPDALIVCNGYKDRAYVETALLAQRLGRTPIIVIDRFHEVDLIIKTAAELGIKPHLGVRADRRSLGIARAPLDPQIHHLRGVVRRFPALAGDGRIPGRSRTVQDRRSS